MSTVLWGGRRGDVQYGGREWRRRNIPVGDGRITVVSARYFDVGMLLAIGANGSMAVVTGLEHDTLGVKEQR